MYFEIPNKFKSIVTIALEDELNKMKNECYYSDQSYYRDCHLLSEKTSKKYGVQCTAFNITANECEIKFEFNSHILNVIRKYGIENQLVIEIMNPTGDAWITSSDVLDEKCTDDDVHMKFLNSRSERDFDFQQFSDELAHAQLLCLQDM